MINTELFFNMLKDKNFFDLKKLSYKYGKNDVESFLSELKIMAYQNIPLMDFNGNKLVYIPMLINLPDSIYKVLLMREFSKLKEINGIENEIENTLKIENIETSRNSIRNIVKGLAPKNDEENKLYGIKKGLDFVSNKSNKITEENLYKLYCLTIADDLLPDERLNQGHYYRHDAVYIVGDNISHQGMDFKILPSAMKKFIDFINAKDKINIIIKSTIIHFYFSYVHPYFNGNGRMARLIQIWYLMQNDFNATISISFSKLISKTKNKYYKSFELIENNFKMSKVIDVTPFISYFNENVFDNVEKEFPNANILSRFKTLLEDSKVSHKEKELFLFSLFHYKDKEFSTLELEKDFEMVSYETIRKFVSKFTELGFLVQTKYGTNRVKYRFLDT